MNKLTTKLAAAAVLLATSGAAIAAIEPPNQVPEPGILELMALAAVVGYIARKRRK